MDLIADKLEDSTPRRRKRRSLSIQPFTALARSLRSSFLLDQSQDLSLDLSPNSPVMVSFSSKSLSPAIHEDSELVFNSSSSENLKCYKKSDVWSSTGSLSRSSTPSSTSSPLSSMDFTDVSTYATLRKPPPGRRWARSAEMVRNSWDFEDWELEIRRVASKKRRKSVFLAPPPPSLSPSDLHPTQPLGSPKCDGSTRGEFDWDVLSAI